MSIRTAANRFIVPSFKAYARFYQQLAASALSIHELGNKLVQHAEQARAFRQTELVSELGLMLVNFPLKNFQIAGHYYLGWAMYRSGNSEQSKVRLEQVAESGIGMYQARALLSLGTLEATKQDFLSEARYYLEAFKASHDLQIKVEAIRGLAVIKAKEGYHRNSIKDFERFLPLAASCDAATYNIYISSLAVELGEEGREQEARNIIKHVLASPFAFAYPEWQETAQDLREPNLSFVAVSPSRFIPHNLLSMPAIEHGESEQEKKQESYSSNSIQAPLSLDLDEADDKVVQFPHLVDVEKLEQESEERFRAEMNRFYALADNCQLHDFVDDILMGNMTPARFAKFLLRMSKFEDIKTVLDVFHFMLRYTFLNSDEFKESETEWTERLSKEIETTVTL